MSIVHVVLRVVLALLASVPFALGLAAAGTHNFSISQPDDAAVQSCDQMRVSFGDSRHPLPMARAEQEFTLAQGATPQLVIHLEESGGMSFTGWDRNEYGITACLAAGARNESRATEVLHQIGIALDEGRVSVRGPDQEDWMVYFIVRVPNDAVLDLASINSPIELRDVSGRIKARVENGPISLADCRGEVDVQAENGPVSVQSGGGRQRLRVHNGPLEIALEGQRWDGEGIDAHAENGPVSLKFPDDYQSGVRLEMSGNSPLQCRSAGCYDRIGDEGDGPRRIDFGSSRPVIRVSAQNGPVDIESGAPVRHSARI
jgi:hypothetical protein